MVVESQIKKNIYSGFTLLEVLIVMAIIGIVAAIEIPLTSKGATHATEASLRANLHITRLAIVRFKADHGDKLPGSINDGEIGAGETKTLRRQLLLPSNANGRTSLVKRVGFPYGPYLCEFPKGPALGIGEDRIGVIMVSDDESLSGDTDPQQPWKYNYTTGEFIYNSSAMSSDGVTTYDRY